jgi:hypothetical protein
MLDAEKTKEQLVAELSELRAQLEQTHKDRLQRVIANTHCILWEMSVTERAGKYFWEMKYLDEEAAQNILPLELPPGESYQRAWDRAIDPDDFARAVDNASRALRAGLKRYTHEYRCRDRHGNLVWLSEEVVVKKKRPHSGTSSQSARISPALNSWKANYTNRKSRPAPSSTPLLIPLSPSTN